MKKFFSLNLEREKPSGMRYTKSCKTKRNPKKAEGSQVKISIAFQRASHVNSGTSIDPEELPWPRSEGRVMRHPRLHLQSDPRGEMTHYGGLVLAQQFVRRFRVAQRLDEALLLFRCHAPYYESDHVLALAYTLYADGRCLEDQAVLQGSEAVRRLVGACRIPDPTTAGDFLRRFRSAQDVEQLSGVIDAVQEAAWSKLPATVRRRRKKHDFALVDLDGHIKPLYGAQKEGADFSYHRQWSYQPLVVSLGGSGECLKVVNQPGSARSSEPAAEALKEVLPQVKRHFRNAIVRGDTDFDRCDILPSEVVRWEWKGFRRHFVYIAAKVLKSGRRLVVRLAGSHRFLPDILTAHARLQT